MRVEMDKETLRQYCSIRTEIKDIQKRIGKIENDIKHLTEVSDTVKGTRPDGTYGPIKVTGFPAPEYDQKQKNIKRLKKTLEQKEIELSELVVSIEKYIETVEPSDLRSIMRFYYIDEQPWWKVAQSMNRLYPTRYYTEDSCRKRNERFLKNN